ncbi:MAG: hypothetical protein P1U44_09835 [Vicingaceae bacterium]|nr:hypothetical protein [Flavobacteriales bacterium]MBQ21017.1 hypothetical protein [Flavobacteriales bacterium]MDF1676003.1 hypothetical protein [Vicingaceae bacterium]|tara:strand:+ start:88312 stop:89364 length:1053 start_codon:yes stop_codon:yes gene_type:complete
MNIFLPFKKDKNPVLDEIEQYFDGNFIYDHYKNFDNHQIDIVNIHWPESIFNYSEPSLNDLSDLETELKKWKTKSKIVYTRHNILPHKSKSENLIELYRLVLQYCDGIIHMGNYSKTELESHYTELSIKKSIVIPHPAYTLFKNQISKSEARKKLKIGEYKNVILVFGSIRTKAELKLIKTAFNNLKLENKYLLISNLNIYKPLPTTFLQRVKKFSLTKAEKLRLSLSNNVTINYNFIENNDVQVYLNAADVLLIPRIDLLNSGNVFLGFSFKKIVVGPKIGNIAEVLEITNNPAFSPKDANSATLALESAFKLHKKKGIENYNFVNNNCHPIIIAKSLKNFFNQLLINN